LSRYYTRHELSGWVTQNKTSLTMLTHGFFKYFARTFPWDTHVVSVTSPGLVPKVCACLGVSRCVCVCLCVWGGSGYVGLGRVLVGVVVCYCVNQSCERFLQIHTCTPAHICIHIFIHTYMPTYMRTNIHAYIHTYKHMCILKYTRTHVHTFTHTQPHTSYIHTHIHDIMQTHKHTYKHSYIHTYITSCKHTNIHTNIHTYKRTNIRAYTHTHIYMCSHKQTVRKAPKFVHLHPRSFGNGVCLCFEVTNKEKDTETQCLCIFSLSFCPTLFQFLSDSLSVSLYFPIVFLPDSLSV